jgi:hypothetical protein
VRRRATEKSDGEERRRRATEKSDGEERRRRATEKSDGEERRGGCERVCVEAVSGERSVRSVRGNEADRGGYVRFKRTVQSWEDLNPGRHGQLPGVLGVRYGGLGVRRTAPTGAPGSVGGRVVGQSAPRVSVFRPSHRADSEPSLARQPRAAPAPEPRQSKPRAPATRPPATQPSAARARQLEPDSPSPAVPTLGSSTPGSSTPDSPSPAVRLPAARASAVRTRAVLTPAADRGAAPVAPAPRQPFDDALGHCGRTGCRRAG